MSFQKYFTQYSSNIKDIYDWGEDYSEYIDLNSDSFYNKISNYLEEPQISEQEPYYTNLSNILRFSTTTNDSNPSALFNPNFIRPSASEKLYKNLLYIDIEDLLKQEGITEVNGKNIKFGSKALRTTGKATSDHKNRNPYTGFANARDISIEGGSISDYEDLKEILLNNQTVVNWMQQNNWGIINEVTPEILAKTKGTGLHFHFGPDKWARRTWNTWLNNPNLHVTKMV